MLLEEEKNRYESKSQISKAYCEGRVNMLEELIELLTTPTDD